MNRFAGFGHTHARTDSLAHIEINPQITCPEQFAAAGMNMIDQARNMFDFDSIMLYSPRSCSGPGDGLLGRVYGRYGWRRVPLPALAYETGNPANAGSANDLSAPDIAMINVKYT